MSTNGSTADSQTQLSGDPYPAGGPMIRRGGPQPVYAQILLELTRLIDTGLPVDAALPSERELAERFGVARMTARKSIDALVRDGRAYRVPGRGAFVARPRLVFPLSARSFTEDIRARGMRPGSRELTRGLHPAEGRVAAALGATSGDAVYVLERLRTADDEPIAIERAHVLAARAPGLFDRALTGSLHSVLESDYGLVIDGGSQIIRAGLAVGRDASELGVDEGSPALCFERLSTAGGRPLEFATSVYRGDRYELQVGLAPGPA